MQLLEKQLSFSFSLTRHRNVEEPTEKNYVSVRPYLKEAFSSLCKKYWKCNILIESHS